MLLKEIASLLLLSRLEGRGEVQVTGIQADSRKVQPGDLFICISGLVSDGHQYAGDAVSKGAAALVAEHAVDADVPQLIVKDSRYAMAVIANHFYGYPSGQMKLIGVTGTNGKTTTTYLIEHIMREQGFRTGLMGTIQTRIGSKIIEAERTTQDVVDLQRNLHEMVKEETEYCIMEVSSHALELGRVKGCRFRTALFTNLTQDHLDYHQTMENYAAAKGLLFSRLGNEFFADPQERQYAVFNADDPASGAYLRQTAVQAVTYGIRNDSDVRAFDVKVTAQGTRFKVSTFRGDTELQMKLLGTFNVYNALAAISAALIEGIPLEAVKQSLENVRIVDGRMESIYQGQDFLVVVDYAHTPDGLENALSTIKEFAEGRVLTVFGCGGDRDRLKRPIMGKIAAQYSDHVLVTSDNPRSEDPEAIMRDIEPGILSQGWDRQRYDMIVERREAIRQAVRMAGPGDVVLIAGKGHETYQIIKGKVYDFDDRLVASEEIRSLQS
ncbi:UDP-N-acetylmuramoyl-L-alanyl-D-glutamate--2,6-diaminopimelate ligase [Ferviditalea candida]|uniref:UDP-N-acetylmuramoyl-L-alanyl-D-glutamate--2,6-diaminopimelate ligase n=1 Tax=Ferviditalea candida TaxID=3108399 RepID=A0ABU5ZDQ4_9BACL|nr:UDP-N-acetylmuramoyl-L-alanyl-D-glutamate--2,6-diaminopimelate ligase [Paenibacillaceae bacterium T2]